MKSLEIENITTGNVVGSVSQSGVSYSDSEFESAVQSEVLDDQTALTTYPYYDEEIDAPAQGFIVIEPGETGYVRAVVDNLPFPYFPVDVEKREEFPSPPLPD